MLQRDAQQRENLSSTIRTIRADTLRQTTDFERLQVKHTEAQRKLGLAEATERALKLQLKSTEQAAKGLKEEMGRMRVLVNQTRAQCANEVRKRERVIEGLKKHAGEGGRQRGTGKSIGVATINVVSGIGEEKTRFSMSVEESGYDLRTETNEFLTELARGLSEENEHLGGLVRRTVGTLRTLSGYQGADEQQQEDGSVVQQIEGSYDVLAGEMDEVIAHLQTLLTNPSFVPIEEVEVREDEIIRLREGWERMEGRWKEAVQMMDGWRKRMARSGQTVNLEELQMGLKLSPVKLEGKPLVDENTEEYDEGDTQADIDAMDSSGLEDIEQVSDVADEEEELEEEVDTDNINSSTFYQQPLSDQEQDEQDNRDEEANETFNTSTSSAFSPPNITALRETINNAHANLSPIQRNHNAFTTILEENTWDLANLDRSPNRENAPLTPKAPTYPVPEEEEDDISFLKTPVPKRASYKSPPKSARTEAQAQAAQLKAPTGNSRLPRPAAQAAMQSPLTMASIAAKLAATEREADAARVRAKLKAARAATKGHRLEPPSPRKASSEDVDPVKQSPRIDDDSAREAPAENGEVEELRESRKRKAAGRTHGGRASRRRSTLSPWELESLILGTASPKKSPSKAM
jgi:hypothetical protein